MSGDTGRSSVSRPRKLARAVVGPGPLRALKDLLYELYTAADAPSLDQIAAAISKDDTLIGAPSRDTIRRCITDRDIPAQQGDTVAIAVVLAGRAGWDTTDVASRSADLWIQARLADPPPGKPLGEVNDPFALEVHHAINADLLGAGRALPALPAYVERDHDVRLRSVVEAAAAGASQLVVLTGGSSTGKTRACWEVLQCLPKGWRLWHPYDPTRPEAALAAIENLEPHTAVWLNEAQHYLLTTTDLGERLAAKLRTLLSDRGRAPVLVLGTMWPEYWHTLTAPPEPPAQDLHAQARVLLTGHDLPVPHAFTGTDLRALATRAGDDPRLAYAANHAESGAITQYLAGAPALLERYRTATDGARALIEAAMDARRLGHGPALPLALLEQAAVGYLTDTQWDLLDEDWLEQALAYTAAPLRGARGPLTRIRPHRGDPPPPQPLYRLADYLEQHGRTARRAIRASAALWNALTDHAAPAHCLALAQRAEKIDGLVEVALRLYTAAWDAGSSQAPWLAANMLAEDGQVDAALLWYERATGRDHGMMGADGAFRGAELLADSGRLEEALPWYGRAAAAGYRDALAVAVGRLSDEGRLEEALAWFERTVANGEPRAWVTAAGQLSRRGRLAEARAWHIRAADAGHVGTMLELGSHADRQGDTKQARNWYTRAADAGHGGAVLSLGLLAQRDGDTKTARAWYEQAAELGSASAMYHLGVLAQREDDTTGARAWYEQAAELGSASAMYHLGVLAQREDDTTGARAWYEQAARGGNARAMLNLGRLAREQGDNETATTWFARAAGTGDPHAKFSLGVLTHHDGDVESARAWYTRAADAGHAKAAEALEGLGPPPN
ncbi:sel1 repeat family protein [Streptomyces sp. NBC_01515]|uniref:tetratricopeptide repeat protein n=1 Tax=Streptomyces sp. NBC_01515 TaxID=2903890 RepID=UPI0038688EC8